jgi:glycine cleavage system P protein (glycine dehydrogenase) subunit 2
MHECVLSHDLEKRADVSTLEIAKRLLDFGIHPPTIYFPLVVPGALMIEPTETESKEILDSFISVMETIYDEALENPERVKSAPQTTPVSRVDEAEAARRPILRWVPKSE